MVSKRITIKRAAALSLDAAVKTHISFMCERDDGTCVARNESKVLRDGGRASVCCFAFHSTLLPLLLSCVWQRIVSIRTHTSLGVCKFYNPLHLGVGEIITRRHSVYNYTPTLSAACFALRDLYKISRASEHLR